MSDQSQHGREFPAVADAAADDDSTLFRIAHAVVVKPGDRVLIRVNPATSDAQLEAFRSELRPIFPGSLVTVIAANDMVVVPATTLETEARPLVDPPDGRPPLPESVPFHRCIKPGDDYGVMDTAP